MNIVEAGNNFKIYGEEVKTYKNLPNGTYEVEFSPLSGFSLSKRTDLAIGEEKIYGNTYERVEKTLNAFESADRNLGVILSGEKGTGKTIFARILACKANEKEIPVVLVNNYIPGISSFISSIKQEILVLFDEFEKTFENNKEKSAQNELLPLFDGIDTGKKLFVVTCNETKKLNEFLLNRPGRFHYHFTLENPSAEEVEEYLTDKLKPEYHHYIERILIFTEYENVPFDWLRAIVHDLNRGFGLEETLIDLNISKNTYTRFDVEINLEDGWYINMPWSFDITGESERDDWVRIKNKDKEQKQYIVRITISNENMEYDKKAKVFYIDPQNAKITLDTEEELSEEQEEYFENLKIKSIVLKKNDYKKDFKFFF